MKLKGLNDAKFIAISIYITTFIIAIDTVGFYAFRQHLFVLSFLFPISIFVGATVVLALVFVPNVSSISMVKSTCIFKLVMRASYDNPKIQLTIKFAFIISV